MKTLRMAVAGLALALVSCAGHARKALPVIEEDHPRPKIVKKERAGPPRSTPKPYFIIAEWDPPGPNEHVIGYYLWLSDSPDYWRGKIKLDFQINLHGRYEIWILNNQARQWLAISAYNNSMESAPTEAAVWNRETNSQEPAIQPPMP